MRAVCNASKRKQVSDDMLGCMERAMSISFHAHLDKTIDFKLSNQRTHLDTPADNDTYGVSIFMTWD